MTETEQNIAIAEVTNGKRFVFEDGNYYEWFEICPQPFNRISSNGKGYLVRATLPNYAGDLNAQFEAWQQLTDEQKFIYRSFVGQIATRERIWAEEAQAKFGAECILRALGKWVESTFPLTPGPK